MAPPDEIAHLLYKIDFRLPEILWVDAAEGETADGRRRDRVKIGVTVVEMSEEVIVRRLALALRIETETGDEKPFVYELTPCSNTTEKPVHVETDLKVGISTVASAGIKASRDFAVLTQGIQAGGLNTSDCEWVVADRSEILAFEPKVGVDAPTSGRLRIEARLHIEVHRRLLGGIVHRAYGISKEPAHRYAMNPSFTAMSTVDPQVERAVSETMERFMNRDNPTTRVATDDAAHHRTRIRILVWTLVALFAVVAALSVVLSL